MILTNKAKAPNNRMHRTAASVPLAVPSGRWPSAAGDAER